MASIKNVPYKISNRLEVRFVSNEVIKISEDNSQSTIKIEPRLMRVLQILIVNSPEVVTRDTFISEIWNNYGGADDALNQAISHLRKILNDNDKQNRLIETIVKKGYRFSGGTDKFSRNEATPHNWSINQIIHYLIITYAVFLFTLLLLLLFNNQENFAPILTKKVTESIESTGTFAPQIKDNN